MLGWIVIAEGADAFAFLFAQDHKMRIERCPWCGAHVKPEKDDGGDESTVRLRPVTPGPIVFGDPRPVEVAEQVDHPNHYGGADNPYEAIKVIEAWALGFCLGNVLKYISRAGRKDDILLDLKKAAWYLAREVEQREKRT